LDRTVIGLILNACEKRVKAPLSKLFAERPIHKHYAAMVHCTPPNLNLPFLINATLDAKTATTDVLCVTLDGDKQQSQLRVSIESGSKY
jgi:23S rRNA-/tRNA-specific pseudouridylate synthase